MPFVGVLASDSRFKRTYEYLAGAVLLATVLGFFGYAAAVSYAAIFKIDGIDPVKIGTHTFFITGVLAVVGALLLVVAQG
jgi:hypothetical protein